MSEKPYKTFGYPVTPLLFVLGNLRIICYSVKTWSVVSLYGLLTIAMGIVFYFYFDKQEMVPTLGGGDKEEAETV